MRTSWADGCADDCGRDCEDSCVCGWRVSCLGGCICWVRADWPSTLWADVCGYCPCWMSCGCSLHPASLCWVVHVGTCVTGCDISDCGTVVDTVGVSIELWFDTLSICCVINGNGDAVSGSSFRDWKRKCSWIVL